MDKITRKKLKQINDLVDKGYICIEQVQSIDACQHWLNAWQLVKELKAPETRDPEDFSYAYYHYLVLPIENWTSDLAMELHNAGVDDASFHQLRIEYVDDYLQHFPDTLKQNNNAVRFLRSKAEALWASGRQEEAEAEFASIIKNYPDNPWGYIGWSDHYWNYPSFITEYAKAERILLQGLAHPDLEDRRHLFQRLYNLYEECEEVEKAEALAERIANEPEFKPKRPALSKPTRSWPPIPQELLYGDDDDDDDYHQLLRQLERKPGRNEPCWCGSGKKYKKCHWRQDKS